MLKISERNREQRTEAVRLVREIVSAFDVRTKVEGEKYPITLRGQRIFVVIAEKKGAFVRPVPFSGVELSKAGGMAPATVKDAIERLIEHGFLTVSGTPTARMAMLHLPPLAIAAFELERKEFKRLYGFKMVNMSLKKALILLDEPAFESFAKDR